MFVVSLELKSQWEPCNNGFYGPKTIDVLIDKNHLYVASRSNGIFFSKDDGNTWVKKSNGLNTNWINCIGKIGNLLILVTHDSGIYVSSDGGENWIQKNNGLPGVDIVALAIIRNSILVSVENQGIYASNDGAENWIKKNLPNNKVKSLYVYKEKIIAATNYTLFYSSDNGNTWFPHNYNPNISSGINCNAYDGSNLFVGTGHGIYLSTDNGENWLKLDLNGKQYFVLTLFLIGKCLFPGTTTGLLKSTDSGKTWCNYKTNSAKIMYIQ